MTARDDRACRRRRHPEGLTERRRTTLPEDARLAEAFVDLRHLPPAAREDVWRRVDAMCRRRIEAVLRRSVAVPESDIDDLWQETLLRAWLHARRFDPARGTLVTWLKAIAVRVARTHMARRRGRERAIFDAARARTADENRQRPGPGLGAAAERRLLAILAALPQSVRVPMERRYLDGEPIERIATALGKTPPSSRSWHAAGGSCGNGSPILSHTDRERSKEAVRGTCGILSSFLIPGRRETSIGG